MPYREFLDPDGLVWNVWDVVPTLVDGLLETDRRAARAPESRPSHAPLEQSLSQGWLCFQHGEQKRRFAPIPDDWEQLPVQSLQTLLSAATHVATRRATETRSSSKGPSETAI